MKASSKKSVFQVGEEQARKTRAAERAARSSARAQAQEDDSTSPLHDHSDSGSEKEGHSYPSRFAEHSSVYGISYDRASVAHVMNPSIGTASQSTAPQAFLAPSSDIPADQNSTPAAQSECPTLSTPADHSSGVRGEQHTAVPSLMHTPPTSDGAIGMDTVYHRSFHQPLAVPNYRSEGASPSVVRSQLYAVPNDSATSASSDAELMEILRARYGEQALQRLFYSALPPRSSHTSTLQGESFAQVSSTTLPVPRHSKNNDDVVLISDSSPDAQSRHDAGDAPATPDRVAPSYPQGTKRTQPANGASSSSSSSAESHAAPAQQAQIVSPRRRSQCPEERCPVCLVPKSQWPNAQHNPFVCVSSSGTRSMDEQVQCREIAATRRLLTSMGAADNLAVNYSSLDGTVSQRQQRRSPSPAQRHPHRSDSPRFQSRLPFLPISATDRVTPATNMDPRIQEVREHERQAYAAGVDVVRSSEERSRDSSAHGSSVSYSSTSSYVPSDSRSTSASSEHVPRWASTLQSQVNSMVDTVRILANNQAQLQQSQLQWQQRQAFPEPMFAPPFHMAPLSAMGGIPHMPPMAPGHVVGSQTQSYGHQEPRAVHYSDQLGVASPAMLHTSRPRYGMRGAPELAPEDLGNVIKFNEFLQKHSHYAASARDQNVSWASVAGLMSRYAEDLAIAFSAVCQKRGLNRTFTQDDVMRLSDDEFEKLYLESCCPTVEYASQVIAALVATPFQGQQPSESSPLPAVMRACEAFRVQLRLLPAHPVAQCTPDAIMDAFLRVLFKAEASTKKMDFQQCQSWEQVKAALISRATLQASWFGDCLRDDGSSQPKPASAVPVPSSSTAPKQSSASQASSSSTEGKHPPSYYERRVAAMKKSGELDGLAIDGLTPKQICKVATTERFRAAKDSEKKQTEAAAKQQADVLDAVAKQAEQIRQLQHMLSRQSSRREPSQERRSPYNDQSDATRDTRTERHGASSSSKDTFRQESTAAQRRQHSPHPSAQQQSGAASPRQDKHQ